MSIVKTKTAFAKDGSVISTTTRKRAKKKPPQIGEGTYTNYQQGIHMLSYHIHDLLTKEVATIEEFIKFYPQGEYNEKVEAIRKVFLETICFTSKLTNWVIAGINDAKERNSAEEGIDF